jgi:GAF domain-containing protein
MHANLKHRLPLDRVITTCELFSRESRDPDYEAESIALAGLMETMAECPSSILQRLSDTAVELCRAGSAGISILENGGEHQVFRWRATSGAWVQFAGNTMHRGASPCGTVIDRNSSLLFYQPQLHFDIPPALQPEIVEALLVPFRIGGRPLGTIWVISHDESRRFDAEDWRLLASLARFTAAAFEILEFEPVGNSGGENSTGRSPHRAP